MDDIYANALINFALYRAYLKDSEYAGNQQRAASHFQLFVSSITAGGTAQVNAQPDQGVVNG